MSALRTNPQNWCNISLVVVVDPIFSTAYCFGRKGFHTCLEEELLYPISSISRVGSISEFGDKDFKGFFSLFLSHAFDRLQRASMTTPFIEGIPETWTTQPKRPFSHLIDQESAPSLSRSDSLQSLNERAGQLGLVSGSVGTSSGAQTPVLMDIERPKRAKIEKKDQQEVIELSDDSDDESVIIMEPAWGSTAKGNANGKGKAKVKKVAKVDDFVRGIWWNDQDKEKRRKQFLSVPPRFVEARSLPRD